MVGAEDRLKYAVVRYTIACVDENGVITDDDWERFPMYSHEALEEARRIAQVCTRLCRRPFGVFESRGVLLDGRYSLRYLDEQNILGPMRI